MDLQDWLIIAGVAIMLGILVDGLRRARLAQKDSLKMSRDMGGHIENSPLDDDFNPELPSGGSRIVSPTQDAEPSFAEVAEESSDTFDPVYVNQSESKDKPAEKNEPFFASESISAEVEDKIEPTFSSDSVSALDDQDEVVDDVVDFVGKARTVEPEADIRIPAQESKKARASTAAATSFDNAQEHEVLVINVDAKPGEVFSGAAIKTLLEACGMEHGEMSIFHRHEQDDLLSPIQFSVANAVEPGYFDPDKMDDIKTPGVSFFMSVPGPKDYLKAFEFMTETARCFAENLKGEMKDEHRSALTSQTIEHCRQRIREFERKQLAKARA